MNALAVSKRVPWAYPDALTICWGGWFVWVAIAGGHLPVPWFWTATGRSWFIAGLGIALTLIAIYVERSVRLSALPPELDEKLHRQRMRHLKQMQNSMEAFEVPGPDATVHLGLLVDWPDYDALTQLHNSRPANEGVAAPARSLRRLVRVDEGVVEFLLTKSGRRMVFAANFFDGTPTFAQYGWALQILTIWQDQVGEARWFPGYDPGANVRILPEGQPDPDVSNQPE